MVTWPRFIWKKEEPHTDLGMGSKEVRFRIDSLRVAVTRMQDRMSGVKIKQSVQNFFKIEKSVFR